ncbi:multidrug oligosaccharidyllipid polysaccharide flippase superfamily [Plasmopara halstedii]|uniref:Multidrug oligosaccharidyllipid polysaccharide flippase superfamily n=1 Tax=Plasmopara halstedii TaxID=4781 RepID=A0A0P1B073_PLAHL|nr:multidrug oligosaccharidyllipid polysaccharide flippase superfamily [Plasmopara halstedii]CEG46864.1 multidrug oligosaccharidyllipid polysaccharide flippase superfamily [Plasmopara halstedii]|eukprot:XP_024583233.1 multidrug oligosaccharidyllipid polysaccharide flippase superfamily [Plasmopara halstedii]
MHEVPFNDRRPAAPSACLSMTGMSIKVMWDGLFRKIAQVYEPEAFKSITTECTPLLLFDAAIAPSDLVGVEKSALTRLFQPLFVHHNREGQALLRLSFQMLLFAIVEFAPNFLSSVLTGHLNAAYSSEFMAARSLALTFNMVTSTTLIAAMSTAMDTLCAQAYGAGQLQELGLFFQTGLLVFCIGFPLVAFAGFNCVELLEFAGQQQDLARLVQSLVILALPGVPFTAINVLMSKILQGQNRVEPLVAIGLVASILQATLLYIFMFQTPLGITGSAVAISATVVCYAVILSMYMYCSGIFRREWPGWQFIKAVRFLPEFLRLGGSGMAMFVCEVWGFASVGFASGLLPHAAAVVSADSSYGNLRWLGALWYVAISLAGSVRVGNALGANDPARAWYSAKLALGLSTVCAFVTSVAMLVLHSVLPFAFTSDERVVSLTSKLLLLTSPLQVFAALSAVSQGIFRGCGLQALGAKVNFVCYILLAVPLGLFLAFTLDLGLLGLWLGLYVALISSGIFSTYWLTFRADWTSLAYKARMRTTCGNVASRT